MNWFSNFFSKPHAPNPNAKGYFLGVGLNRVDPQAYGGWDGKLIACHNDVQALRALITLGKRWQSPAVLFDQYATIKGCEIAYRTFAHQAQPGDLMVIVQSRHGGQFRDIDKDEADGLDETLCLWDGQVPDDVHAHWLAYFKPGVRVLLIVDACHSQTVSRAAIPANQPATKAMPRSVRDVAGDLQEASIRALRALYKGRAEIQASVVTLAACHDSQTALDGEQNGLFTTGLLNAFNGGIPSSYEDWLRKARRYCGNQQTPQIELIGPAKHVKGFAQQKPFTL